MVRVVSGMPMSRTSQLPAATVQAKELSAAIVIVTSTPVTAKTFAGKLTKTRFSSTILNKMKKRDGAEMEEQPLRKKRRSRAEILIDDAMSGIEHVEIQTDSGVFKIVSMGELPIDHMVMFSRSDNDEKMPMMLDFIKMCLVNPEDWNKIEMMPFGKVNGILKQWMEKSSGI